MKPYFRHKEKECDGFFHEPETQEHIEGKIMLFNWIRNIEGIENCILEAFIPETRQRPDIYFECNGNRYVIEYQCSPISSEFLERRELYKLAGINDIWILGVEKYIKEHDRSFFKQKVIESHIETYLNVKSKILIFNENVIRGHLPFKKIELKNKMEMYLQEMSFDCIRGSIIPNLDYIDSCILKDKEKYESNSEKFIREEKIREIANYVYSIAKNNNENINYYGESRYYCCCITIKEKLPLTIFFKDGTIEVCRRRERYNKYSRYYKIDTLQFSEVDQNEVIKFLKKYIKMEG